MNQTTTTIHNIDLLVEALQPIRQRLLTHPLYQNIKTIENLRIFTEHHVYAVWDFMTLLKALQIRLTSVTLPWKPIGDPSTRYFINEIVTGEESDIDENGIRSSHYELYLRAMEALEADTKPIQKFVQQIDIDNYHTLIVQSGLPDSVQEFLRFTFETALNAPLHILSAVFTFGREDLIPDMFIQIVRELSEDFPEQLSIFKYYLERHIEVDGDEHSILGKQMVASICGNDGEKWKEATHASITSLEKRYVLWSGVLKALDNH